MVHFCCPLAVSILGMKKFVINCSEIDSDTATDRSLSNITSSTFKCFLKEKLLYSRSKHFFLQNVPGTCTFFVIRDQIHGKWCRKDVGRMWQGCDKGVARMWQGCGKEISWKLNYRNCIDSFDKVPIAETARENWKTLLNTFHFHTYFWKEYFVNGVSTKCWKNKKIINLIIHVLNINLFSLKSPSVLFESRLE